ncbi:MAG TPA: hypothetical protein VMD91_15740 [Candidatus Sulfotelmatobacter sp.]|nr:hypothetical protein [Candidatus Sulfotelmatobacter sp.]
MATATPTPAPSPNALAAGDTFVYAGQLVQSFQTFTEITPPGASPEPIATTTTNVTQTVTVAAGQNFNGTAGLVDLHDAETDALSSGLKTTTSTTDAYEALTNTQLLAYGSQFADEAGDTQTTLATPADVLDQLPETAGARWSNGPGATIDEAVAGDASGSPITVVRTVNDDGTYNEKTTYPPNYAVAGADGVGDIQENADGSGTFAFEANGETLTITYSPPEPQASGPALITINEYLGLDTTVAPYQTFQVPTWYGNAPALYDENDLDQGTQTIPSGCGLTAAFPAQATALAQTIARTDTILGYTEQETTTRYVAPGYGVLCTVSTDQQTFDYDFSGDQAFAFTMTPPLEIATVTETLGMQPSSTIPGLTLSGARRARGTASAASVPGARLDVGAVLHARFERAVLAARVQRAAQLARAAAARLHRSGGAL